MRMMQRRTEREVESKRSEWHYPLLCGMMFLQFAVYGLWLPIAGRFLKADPVTEGGLGFSDAQVGWIIGLAASLGAICSPFVTQFADRHFPAQRFLGVLMICAGLLKLITVTQTSFTAWLVLSILFAMLFMPAAAICSALAMRHLSNPTQQFPRVRLWSTVGWISVAWFFPLLALKTNVEFRWLPPFFAGDDVELVAAEMLTSVRWSGMLAIGYGVLAFFLLPHTPPLQSAGKRFAVLEAFAMLRQPTFCVLLLVVLLLSITHVNYFVQMSSFLRVVGLDDAYTMPAMSLGQVAELSMYVLLGSLLTKFGFRRMLLMGILAFVLRFSLHASTDLPIWCQVVGQAFHGVCYAFFFTTSMIYVDRIAPSNVRNSAQSVFNFVFYGVGPLLAVQINSQLAHAFGSDGGLNAAGYRMYWYAMASIACVALVIMWAFFRDQTTQTTGFKQDAAA